MHTGCVGCVRVERSWGSLHTHEILYRPSPSLSRPSLPQQRKIPPRPQVRGSVRVLQSTRVQANPLLSQRLSFPHDRSVLRPTDRLYGLTVPCRTDFRDFNPISWPGLALPRLGERAVLNLRCKIPCLMDGIVGTIVRSRTLKIQDYQKESLQAYLEGI